MKKTNKELKKALKERELRLLLQEKARRSLLDFVTYTKPDYIHSTFSRKICSALDKFLDDVLAGKRPILLLHAPPQHGKSELVSRRLPPYIFGRYPHMRIAACSYAADLARDMNRDVQRIMLDDDYATLFPGISLNPKRVVTQEDQALRNSERFDIPGARGYYICAGVGGPLTGKSVDIGIIDDPIKNESEARSTTIKKSIEGWYNSVFLTRLSKNSGQIIMMTRWVLDDLAGVIKKNNPKAKILNFAAVTDEKALVPELHPYEKLMETKAMLSPAQWSAMYQQSPIQEGGNIFQDKWIRRWNNKNLPDFFDEKISSWDMSFKDTQGTSYVTGQLWGRAGVNYFLLDQVRKRMDFVETVRAVQNFDEKHPDTMGILIEDKANGPAVMSTLSNEISGLIAINPEGSKISRAYAITYLFAGGNVYIPEDSFAPWVKDYIAELVAFPAGPEDDQVDGTTQALNHLKHSGLAVWEALGGK